MAKTAIFQYKCRLCGETYDDAHTVEEVAKMLLPSIVHGYKLPQTAFGIVPMLIATHPGCRLGYGVSDLIGYVVKKG